MAGLDAWFVHDKLVLNLLNSCDATDLSRRMSSAGTQTFATAHQADLMERAVAKYLADADVAVLDVALHHGAARVGQLVHLEQAIAFKGLPAALTKLAKGETARATFSAKLATDLSVMVRGSYSASRLTCNTAESQLSGTSGSSCWATSSRCRPTWSNCARSS